MFVWYKRWRDRAGEKKFRAAIRYINEVRPDLLKQFILYEATKLAAAILMQELDKKGIRHCALCPSQDQLRRVEARFYCHDHAALADQSLKQTVAAQATKGDSK